MTNERPPNIEKTDASQKTILVLVVALLLVLCLISFILFKFNHQEFKTQKNEKKFTGEPQVHQTNEFDNFESGNPRRILDQNQEKNLKNLDKAILLLSTKSISEIDHIFVTHKGDKK